MVPVGITVEGANILTRSLITFAQGALRSHPFLFREIKACEAADRRQGLLAFDEAFSGHVAFSIANLFGAIFHNVTGGRFGEAPPKAAGMERWYAQIWRQSHNFALVADLMVALLGGGLKTKQKLTGRMADALSELYLGCCVLKRYEDDGRPAADRHIVEMCLQNGLYRCQQALSGAIDNFPNAAVRVLLRFAVFPLGHPYRPAADRLASQCVRLATEPGEVRDRLTREIFVSRDPNDPTGILEVTLEKVVAAEEAERKLERAIRQGIVRRYHGIDWIGDAVSKGVLTADEGRLLKEVEELTQKVIAVDHFDAEEVRPHYMTAGHNVLASGVPAAQ
jgi:acyl-CoA dehydrogenase